MMEFESVAIGLGDVTWISLAFALGFFAKLIGLPPLVGFLAAGFVLKFQGFDNDILLQKLADLGITLLLFTVGLKLNLQTLLRPQVWAVTGIHMTVVVGVFGLAIYGLSLAGVVLFSDLNIQSALLLGFALSFSSTVFVVKVLEERGEVTSLHGRISVGILLMQDVAAVAFLVISSGKVPSYWSLSLLLLIPLRPILHQFLLRIGHGELLVLFGLLLALGGAEIFESVGLKGDLGALTLGVLIASYSKSEEMAKAMLSFKDLFLLGFFLSIGMSSELSSETFWIAVMVTPLIFVKSALFYGLLTHYRLRARTSLLTTANLTNYSEFGLIVVAIGVTNGWLQNDWLIVVAIALSLSFVIAAGVNAVSRRLYIKHIAIWKRFQKDELIPDDELLDLGGATIVIVGMGGVGSGAYDAMRQRFGENVIGIDIDPVTAKNQRTKGRTVLRGDPSDSDFWDRVEVSHTLELVMLTLPKLNTTLEVLERLSEASFRGEVAAIARYSDEVEALEHIGVATVFNIYAESGVGFAAHVANGLATSGRDAKI